MTLDEVEAALPSVLAAERARVVATLIRDFGDWGLAEDCLQDAVERALVTWPRDGVPRSPGAWLTTVARRRAVDVLRRRNVERTKLAQAAWLDEETGEVVDVPAIDDERLRLIFTCCHPAMSIEAQVALTLRFVAGLSTAQIAQAFLVSEPTMSQRLLRAKQRIATAGIPFRIPDETDLAERLAAVLGVVYLVFNAGYSREDGDELVAESIRLASTVAELLPNEPEARGLLALLLFQRSRRAARFDADGVPIPFEEQDPALWDRVSQAAAERELQRELARLRGSGASRPGAPDPTGPDPGGPGRYVLEAMIAGSFAVERPDGVDWSELVALHDALLRVHPSPVGQLNRAVAIGMRDGMDAGLATLDALAADGALDSYYLLPAARADLLRRAGRTDEAAPLYREAAALAPTEGERTFLLRRASDAG